jgi:hypothetical protein
MYTDPSGHMVDSAGSYNPWNQTVRDDEGTIIDLTSNSNDSSRKASGGHDQPGGIDEDIGYSSGSQNPVSQSDFLQSISDQLHLPEDGADYYFISVGVDIPTLMMMSGIVITPISGVGVEFALAGAILEAAALFNPLALLTKATSVEVEVILDKNGNVYIAPGVSIGKSLPFSIPFTAGFGVIDGEERATPSEINDFVSGWGYGWQLSVISGGGVSRNFGDQARSTEAVIISDSFVGAGLDIAIYIGNIYGQE